jgi:hypothetical protein
MRAGEALVEEAEHESADRNFLVYPILFNYRHGLELALKWTIAQYGSYVDVYLDKQNIDHNLWYLWRLCKQIIIDLSDDEEDDDLRAVERIVKDFHDLDKNALAFRYSRTRDGGTILLPDAPIDLRNIQRVMEAVDNFFSGVDGQLDAIASAADW